MTEFLRLVSSLRREIADPLAAFHHRLRVGLAVAALILILSQFR